MSKLELQSCVIGSVGTNCYFLKNKETNEMVIIDPPDQAVRISQKVNEMGGKPVAILLTHGHFDHIMAAEELRETYGIKIYATVYERKHLGNAAMNLSGFAGKAISLEADEELDDLDVFELAGFDIQVIHTPGHTPGSCCYYLKDEDVLFSGDTLFCGSAGRTDFPGGSMQELQNSLNRLVESLPEETKVYPGHEAPTTIGYEKRYNPFV